jgi:hypothetical protein
MQLEDEMEAPELRREVRTLWNRQHAFDMDMRDLPEVPSISTMRLLSSAAMNVHKPDLMVEARRLQYEHPSKVPYKSEYERAAGLWSILRNALIAARDAE